jgi:hypothetical protein
MKCTRIIQSRTENLEIGNLKIGQVRSFEYLETTINEDNSIEEDIKERIELGNKASYSNKRMFQSKFISRGAKLKLYWSVVSYTCETWILIESDINQ